MFKELEFKYRADHVRLSEFKALMGELASIRHISAASWDIYYIQDGKPDSFQRFRMDSLKPELTKKVKTQDANNWYRVESDLPLSPKITEEQVSVHVGLDGYRENFRIFKACDIYVFEHLNFVFYVVFNHEMQEIGRFIEVEVNKDSVEHLDDEAMFVLRSGEVSLFTLGITAQNRLKKSLFELYRKDVS